MLDEETTSGRRNKWCCICNFIGPKNLLSNGVFMRSILMLSLFISFNVFGASEQCAATKGTQLYVDCDLVKFCSSSVVADGITDQTDNITSCFNTKLDINTRGMIYIPYNVKFDTSKLMKSPYTPVGIILNDQSQVSWSNSSGYKSKMITLLSKDTEADDTGLQIISGHHPSLRLNNLGTSGTTSAAGGFASILFSNGTGTDSTGIIPNDVFNMQMRKEQGKWIMDFRSYELLSDPNSTRDTGVFRIDETGNTQAFGGISGGSYTNMNSLPNCPAVGTMIFIGGSITAAPRPVFYKGNRQWVESNGANSIVNPHALPAGCP